MKCSHWWICDSCGDRMATKHKIRPVCLVPKCNFAKYPRYLYIAKARTYEQARKIQDEQHRANKVLREMEKLL